MSSGGLSGRPVVVGVPFDAIPASDSAGDAARRRQREAVQPTSTDPHPTSISLIPSLSLSFTPARHGKTSLLMSSA